MKNPGKWILVLALALAAGARAADGGTPGHCSGRAVDERGQPVAGATVECYVDSSPAGFYTAQDFALKERGTTDSKGGFTVPIGVGVTIVVVKKEGLAPGWRTFASVLEESTDPVVLTGLASPARSEVDTNGRLISYSAPVSYALEGKVVDENGQPVAGADVWVTMAMPIPGGGVPAPVVQFAVDPVSGMLMAALPGGEFSQRSMIFGKPARDCFSTRTGADGRFRIANFPGHTQANLMAHKSGMAMIQPANLGQGGRVAGFGFIIPGILNNPGNIAAPPPYMSGQNVNLADASLQHDLMPCISGELNIELVVKRAGNIEGKVTLATGDQPVAGVKLIPLTLGKGLSGLQMPEPVLSGADGSFRIADVVPGRMTIAAVFPGDPVSYLGAQDVTTTVAAGETSKSLLFLAARCRITGTVRDSSGKAVSGAIVSLNPGANNLQFLTDASGHYEASSQVLGGVIQRSPSVLVQSAERHLAAIQGIDESTTNLDLDLLPSVTVTARVEEPGGKPVAGANASLSWRIGNRIGALGYGVTDAEGRIEFADMPAVAGYSMSVQAKGHGQRSQDVAPPNYQTNRLAFPTIVLPAANLQLAGTVLGADSKPVAGARVNVNADGLYNTTTTDYTGHFAFDGVTPGPVSLSANGHARTTQGVLQSAGMGSIRAEAGETNVVIRFAINAGNGGNMRMVTTSGTMLDPSGAPVSGARLSVLPNAGSGLDIASDADGKYSVTWVEFNSGGSADSMTLLYVRDLEHNLAGSYNLDETITNLDLRLQPGLTLSVKVRDASGNPISTATETLSLWAGNSRNTSARITAKANDQGIIEVSALPQETHYSAILTAPGYGLECLDAPIAVTATRHFDFPATVLKRADRQLAGIVVDTNGMPVATARVTLSQNTQIGWQMLSYTNTDAEGRFRFDAVPEGKFRMNAIRLTSGSAMSTFVEAQGGDTNVVVPVAINTVGSASSAPVLTTSGTVFDLNGKPAAGVRVKVWGDFGKDNEVRTGADGRYVIHWQTVNSSGRRWTFFIFARDLERNLAASKDLDEKTTNLDLTLEPGLTLSASVRDVNGRPIAGATEVLSVWSGQREIKFNEPAFTSDNEGNIEITALPQGWHYSAAITAKGYGASYPNAQAADTETNRFSFPTAVLRAADRRLGGRVLSADSKPVAGARVELGVRAQNGLQAAYSTNTDAEGRFIFDAVPEGTFQMNVNGAGGDRGMAQVEGGDTNVVFRFRAVPLGAGVSMPMMTFSGTVYDPSGKPDPGVILTLMPGASADVTSDAEGKFTISWRPSLVDEHLFTGRDLKGSFAATVSLDERATNVNLHLREALTLSGSVQDDKGAALKSATVRLMLTGPGFSTGMDKQAAKLDEQGAFSFSVLPRGQTYSVSVTAPGFGWISAPVGADQTETASLQLPPIRLQRADRALEGQVVGPDGKPVAGVMVTASGPGQPSASKSTDANGHFAFKVCEGTVHVAASVPRNATNNLTGTGSIQAQAGDLNVVLKLAARSTVPSSLPPRNGQTPTNGPPTSTPPRP
jgi:protocatechuate 3,4-dioxygenase beta subunit